jgi:hypothetical protein
MANHAYVKTKKVMKPQAVTELIERLNSTIFKNCLTVKYKQSPKSDKSAWGEHCWIITVKGDSNDGIGSRVCWLNTSRSFEMRHGGGSQFMWWVDSAICNEIAVQFKGTWTDDGVGGKMEVAAGQFNRWRKYLKSYAVACQMRERSTSVSFDAKAANVKMWAQMQMEGFSAGPPEFELKNWRFFVGLKKKGTNDEVWDWYYSVTPNPKYGLTSPYT